MQVCETIIFSHLNITRTVLGHLYFITQMLINKTFFFFVDCIYSRLLYSHTCQLCDYKEMCL